METLMNFQKQVGFTLVELLITLAILVLLVALLTPVFMQGTRHAHETVCLSNLQQMSMGLSMYVADSDGSYPSASVGQFHFSYNHNNQCWLTLVQPYLRNVGALRCPDTEVPGRLAAFRQNSATWGYAYNARLDEAVGNRQHKTFIGKPDLELTSQALTATIYDARSGIIAGRGPDLGQTADELYGIYRIDFIVDILAQTEGARRHHGGANYAFADGHSSWFLPAQLRKNKHSDGIHPGFGL
jgi:prepilin-type N-terminal cleavage/methylation domain-containing protein/prepilin-type processing-associated H-X9-DG protein